MGAVCVCVSVCLCVCVSVCVCVCVYMYSHIHIYTHKREQVMMEKRSLVESSIRCPISGAVMKDPVLAPDGYTYDRPSITQWLSTKSTSPVYMYVYML